MIEYNEPFNKPNFFILGAGKSGTTTLWKYLKSHPKIFLSKIKEPTFFCEDFQVVNNPIKYFELFNAVQNETYIGEASHGYLSDPKVARLIRALFPNSKFVLILRNPADRAYSLYNHMRRHGLEKNSTFEKALSAEKNRINSEFFRNNNPQFFHNFLYFESGKYGAQIQRYLSLFEREQFLFLRYEDLVKNPEVVFSDICKFLEIDKIDSISHPFSNKGYEVKSILLEKIINSRVITNRFLNKLKINKALTSLNRNPLKPMNPETKLRLMKRYKEDLDLLYELTGIRI